MTTTNNRVFLDGLSRTGIRRRFYIVSAAERKRGQSVAPPTLSNTKHARMDWNWDATYVPIETWRREKRCEYDKEIALGWMGDDLFSRFCQKAVGANERSHLDLKKCK